MARSITYRVRAIVLDKVKLKETDLILTLLSDEGERIGAVAKGARKPGSRLAARCELFCNVDLLLARGRSLDVVSQAELLESPMGAAPGFMELAAASAVAEVAKHCSFEESQDPFVYAITLRALEIVGTLDEDDPHIDLIVAAFVFKVLSHMGYRPDCEGCVSCGDASLTFFSATAGGFICGSCAASIAGAEPVDRETADWLRALIGARFDELLSSAIDATRATQLLALAHIWAASHLDCRLRSIEFMLGR